MKITCIPLAFALAGIAGPASALPRESVMFTYYSDAAFTHMVGSQVRPNCNGAPSVLHGSRGHYVSIESYTCEDFEIERIYCEIDGGPVVTCPVNICDSHIATCN